MINTLIATITTALSLGFTPLVSMAIDKDKVLSTREMSLENRYGVKSVNEVFKKNILLNIAYLDGSVKEKSDIDWEKVTSFKGYSFILKPNETFAYHDEVLEQYKGEVSKTTNARFNASDGFVSDGYLYGDGVCHLASLINWAASDAGLTTKVTKNHDFANIPEVPKEYGVSIYVDPSNPNTSANRNLYITNNKQVPVEFSFEYENGELSVSVIETG